MKPHQADASLLNYLYLVFKDEEELLAKLWEAPYAHQRSHKWNKKNYLDNLVASVVWNFKEKPPEDVTFKPMVTDDKIYQALVRYAQEHQLVYHCFSIDLARICQLLGLPKTDKPKVQRWVLSAIKKKLIVRLDPGFAYRGNTAAIYCLIGDTENIFKAIEDGKNFRIYKDRIAMREGMQRAIEAATRIVRKPVQVPVSSSTVLKTRIREISKQPALSLLDVLELVLMLDRQGLTSRQQLAIRIILEYVPTEVDRDIKNKERKRFYALKKAGKIAFVPEHRLGPEQFA